MAKKKSKSKSLSGLNIEELESGPVTDDLLRQHVPIPDHETPSTDFHDAAKLCSRLRLAISQRQEVGATGIRFPGQTGPTVMHKPKDVPLIICKHIAGLIQAGEDFGLAEKEVIVATEETIFEELPDQEELRGFGDDAANHDNDETKS